MIYSFRKKLVIIAILTFIVASFYAEAAVPVNINSGNPAYPFPQFLDYGPDRKSLASHNAPGVTHAEMEQRMRDAWKHICNNCKYFGETVDDVPYIFPDINEAETHCTCVEGDGYYLLGAALMGDKDFFDGYYMWAHDRAFRGTRRFLDGEYTDENYAYSKGLSGAGSFSAPTAIGAGYNGNSAADGDVDVAMALLIAYKQWGEKSGVQTAIGELNYKEEALKYIKALVDTVVYAPSLPEITYVTGIVGMDGYLKNGDSWGELTYWGATNGYQGLKDQNGGGTMVYFDYSAPAYFHQYRKFLEENNGTDWQLNQLRRCEVSSDWLMGQLYQSSNTAIPVCGHVSSISDTEFEFSGNGPFAEDMRAGWRTILNYVWHGDPEYSWDPVTHEAISGSNSYQKDMALRYAKFLANPQSAPWNNDCNAIGDMGLKFWGPYTLRNKMDLEGNIGDGFPLNWIHGSGSPAAIVSQDFELMGQMFRHCVMTWDDENFKSYEESSPHYFHEWFKLLGMLVLSGNFHAPENMVAKPNLKVYHKVDKTYAFAGDEVEFVVTIRNYGSVEASGTLVKFGIPEGFSLVSTTKGSLVGDSIEWKKDIVPGFKTATGIEPTVDSMVIKLRLNNDIKQGRYCTSASVKCDNGFGWVSDEYPNNITSVMERNCVDVVARALKVEKTVDRKEINPNNIAQFKIDFENSAEAGWINGGRQGVRLSYGHKPVANPSNTDQIV
ncbi:MAG: glycosyl hydrolase family 8, partial [Paludibacteraceae bacterium]|nr:glycosyl hydrolase family 8 [Paludibacteraceae bacterium]